MWEELEAMLQLPMNVVVDISVTSLLEEGHGWGGKERDRRE